MLLAKLAHHVEYRRVIGQIPHVMNRLVRLLEEDVSQDVPRQAVHSRIMSVMSQTYLPTEIFSGMFLNFIVLGFSQGL
jgi:hypothetical protein